MRPSSNSDADLDNFGVFESDCAATSVPRYRGRASSLPNAVTTSELTSLPEEDSTSVFINIVLLGEEAREIAEELCKSKSCSPCVFTHSWSPSGFSRQAETKPHYACYARIFGITAQVNYWPVCTFVDSIPHCATVENESTVYVFLVSADRPSEPQFEEFNRRIVELRYYARGPTPAPLLTFSLTLQREKEDETPKAVMKTFNAWFKKHNVRQLALGKGLCRADIEGLHACLSNEVVMEYCMRSGIGSASGVLGKIEDSFLQVRKHFPRMLRRMSS